MVRPLGAPKVWFLAVVAHDCLDRCCDTAEPTKLLERLKPRYGYTP